MENRFQGCTFENVTFVYNGTTAPQFSNNNVHGSVGYTSDNPAVLGTLAWMRGFGVIKDDVQIIKAPENILEAPMFGARPNSNQK
jgi:hypothetical protein